mgnify:FL=1|jgi:hypothetical protein
MQTLVIIIVLQVAVTLLAGCSEFEVMMEERNKQLNCSPSYETLCDGWQHNGEI